MNNFENLFNKNSIYIYLVSLNFFFNTDQVDLYNKVLLSYYVWMFE